MAGASEVRAGAAFIEIRADDSQFQRSVKSVHNRFVMVGQSLRRIGSQLAAAGVAMGVPLVLAATHAARFEDALLELQASVSDLRPDQLKRVREEALRMSKEMGVAPERIAEAFTLLVKAGMSVEDALNGAAKTAVEFARISGVSAQEAATFMKVAMNVFGGSAASAADTLSAAADASETDIRHMVEAFGLVGSAGKTFDQTLFDISQGFAVLARYGIQGEEAGTGIKVMLQRLIAPSREAEKALAKVGFSITNFRDTEGRMLPLVQIVGVLAKRLQSVDKITRDQVLDQVFGDRGVRVVGAFLDMGVEGFDDLATAMEHNLPVSEKFRIVMSGLSGLADKFLASAKRLAIAVAGSLGNGLKIAVDGVSGLADRLSYLLERFPILGKTLGFATAALLLVGGSFLAASAAISVFAFSLRAISAAATAFGVIRVAAIALAAQVGELVILFDGAVATFGLFGGVLASIGAAAMSAWGLVVAGATRVYTALATMFAMLTSTETAFFAWASQLHMFQVAQVWVAAFTVKLAAAWSSVVAYGAAVLDAARAGDLWLVVAIHCGNAMSALGAYAAATGTAMVAAFQGAVAWVVATSTAIAATIAEVGLVEAAILGWGLATETVFFAVAGIAGAMSTVLATATAAVLEFGAMVVEVGLLEVLTWGIAAAWDAVLVAVAGVTGMLSLGLIPLIALAVAGLAYIFGFFGSSKPPDMAQPKAGASVARSVARDPMSEPGAGLASGDRGKSVGTFSGAAASQLGIGPDASSAAATATNTGRTADAAEELVRMSASAPEGSGAIPPAANLQAGLSNARNGVAPTAPAGWDRDMLSAAERTALAVEAALPVLRNLLTATKSMSPAFG